MGSHVLRLTLVLITCLGLQLGVLAPAHAAQWAKNDPRGDAFRTIDITRVNVNNTQRRLRATVRIPQLNRSAVKRVSVLIFPRTRPDSDIWFATARRAREGAPLRSSLRYGLSATIKVPCRGFRLSWQRRSFSISVPHRCLKGARGPTRVRVSTESIDGSFDLAPRNDSPYIPRG